MDAGQVAAARGGWGVEGLNRSSRPLLDDTGPGRRATFRPRSGFVAGSQGQATPGTGLGDPPADPSRPVSMVENIKPAPVVMRLAATRAAALPGLRLFARNTPSG